MRESARDDEVGRGDGGGRGGGVTDMRTEEAFIRVRHVFPRWLHSASLLSRTDVTSRGGAKRLN